MSYRNQGLGNIFRGENYFSRSNENEGPNYIRWIHLAKVSEQSSSINLWQENQNILEVSRSQTEFSDIVDKGGIFTAMHA